MLDVALVQMPYGPVERPSIALGVLTAALAETEISARALYPNLAFCQDIGLDVYCALAQSAGTSLLAEWTFSAAAFPELEADPAAFFALPSSALMPSTKRQLTGRFPSETAHDRLLEVRAQAAPFIDRVADEILAWNPRVVGCTSTFQQHCPALALLRRVRELAPDVVTMLGGANCESVMGLATLRMSPFVDVVVSGEADLLFEDLCRRLLTHGRALDGVELPYGALAQADLERGRFDTGGEAAEVPRAAVSDMDRVPVPDYRSYFEALRELPLEAYIEPGLPIETSRGCWWGAKSHCTFCGLNGGQMTFRSKSADRVLDELATLGERHAIDRFEAVDNILDLRFFKTVLPALASRPDPPSLFYETKANLKRGQMELLAKAGVTWIQPGIEGLHPSALELLRKGNSPTINIQCLKWALEYGIRVEWLFLYGIPGEEDAWYAELADWLPALYHLEPPAGATQIEFHRFSPYQMEPAAFGLDLAPQPGYRQIYPISERAASDLAYYFENRASPVERSSADERPKQGPGLTAFLRCLGEWLKSWHREEDSPRLLRVERDDRVTLVDTRPCAVARERRLDAVESAALRATDLGATRESVLRQVRAGLGADIEDAAIDAALASLTAARAVLDLGGTYLGLAVRDVGERVELFAGGEPLLRRFKEDWLRSQLDGLPIPASVVSTLLSDAPQASATPQSGTAPQSGPAEASSSPTPIEGGGTA